MEWEDGEVQTRKVKERLKAKANCTNKCLLKGN